MGALGALVANLAGCGARGLIVGVPATSGRSEPPAGRLPEPLPPAATARATAAAIAETMIAADHRAAGIEAIGRGMPPLPRNRDHQARPRADAACRSWKPRCHAVSSGRLRCRRSRRRRSRLHVVPALPGRASPRCFTGHPVEHGLHLASVVVHPHRGPGRPAPPAASLRSSLRHQAVGVQVFESGVADRVVARARRTPPRPRRGVLSPPPPVSGAGERAEIGRAHLGGRAQLPVHRRCRP